MLSPSPLNPSAPSASLLRFLRAQSESALFSKNQPSACRRVSTKLTSCSSTPLPVRRPSGRTNVGVSPLQTRFFSGVNPSSRNRTSLKCASSVPPSPPSGAFEPPSKLPQTRNFSSTRNRSILRRFWDFRRKKPAAETRKPPSLLDDTDGGLSLARALAAKASNELRLRCTEFDMNGNVTLMNGEFKKSELIARVSVGALNENDKKLMIIIVWPSPA